MSNEQELSRDTAQSAAYELARSLHFLRGWQTVFWRISLTPERPWKLEYPNDLFVRSFTEPPYDALDRIEESLQTLVLYDRLDAVALVELHRSVDALSTDCDVMVGMAQNDDRDEIIELYWQSGSGFDLARKFAERCVTTYRSLHFFCLGDAIGQLIEWGCNHSDIETAWALLRGIVNTIEMNSLDCDNLREWLTRLESEKEESGELDANLRRDLVAVLLRIDEKLRRPFLGDSEQPQPLVELDDSKECLVFLGVRIPFSDFATSRARGGLKLFRVLIKNPDTYLSVAQIVELADISREPEGIFGANWMATPLCGKPWVTSLLMRKLC